MAKSKLPAFLQANTVKKKKKGKGKGKPFGKADAPAMDKADASTGLISRKPFGNKGY